jgi:hypothetical protein
MSWPADAAADGGAIVAVLVLDAHGNVVAANRSSRDLWGTPDRSLVGLPLAGLVAQDPPVSAAGRDADWKKLRSEALDQWKPIAVVPLDGGPQPARLRLEKALGGAGTYIAIIQTPAAPRS